MLHHSSEVSPSHCSLPLAMLQALLRFGSPSVGELPAFISQSLPNSLQYIYDLLIPRRADLKPDLI